MAKLARFSDSSKPLPRLATMMIEIFAVSGLLFRTVISSGPDILGICMSVTIRSGCKWVRICRASTPLVADSTVNSLDSKISPHSLHSTNSQSSSRLTICTRGCLQGCCFCTLAGGDGDLEVINPEGDPQQHESREFHRNFPVF